MNAQVVDVDERDDQAEPVPAAAADAAPSRPPAKFLHPGGSRPLTGYTLKRGVGQGGFGEIYYAVSDAGKEVALKLIRRNLEVELRGIRQCLNLKHPNLLDLYDIRQDEQGDTWVVMEFVAGQSLEQALAAYPAGMPAALAMSWLQGIAAGVAHLHDRGIVHRDLKPGNVFSNDGVVKVGDYGLSKFISCSRRSGHTESIGTVHYMAPEIANGRYGKEIDIYALGVMLYEMLTGRVPFDGESVGEVLMKHLTAQPDLAAVAPPYRGVIAKALEKDPAERFHSVAEMLAGLPLPAGPLGGVARLPSAAAIPALGAAAVEAVVVPAGASLAVAPRPAASALQETIVQAQPADEEPIQRAIRENWRKLRRAWSDANLSSPVKILLLLAAIFVLLQAAGVLIPVAVVLVMMYGVYYLVRLIVVSLSPPAPVAPIVGPRVAAAPLTAAAPAAARAARTPFAPRPREPATVAWVVKTPRERVASLLGSLLGGAMATAAMTVVMVLLLSHRGAVPRPEQVAWLALTSLAGTWAVMICAKFWEGSRGEAILRRFALMVVGLGLGALSFGAASLLMVTLPASPEFPKGEYHLPPSFYAAGSPLVMAHLACFGTLLLVMRWWRQADPLRGTRLSLWTLLVSVGVAAVVAAAWQFPQPWLPMIAATMSVSIQLACPWNDPRARRA